MNLNNYPQELNRGNWYGFSSMDCGLTGGHNNWANINTSRETEAQQTAIKGNLINIMTPNQLNIDPKRKLLDRNPVLEVDNNKILDNIEVNNPENPFLFGDNGNENPNENYLQGDATPQFNIN